MSEGEHMGNCLGRNRILTVLGFFRLFFDILPNFFRYLLNLGRKQYV